MFCSNCGTRIPEGVEFCPRCGGPVNQAPLTRKPEQSGKSGKLKFIIAAVAAVVVAVAGIILLSGNGDSAPVEPLAGAPNGVYPLPAEGNSRPVNLKPLPGITIFAEEDALDHDRDINLTFADGGSWAFATQELKDNEDVIPLCAFDFDAGMKSDDILPGTIDITFDLKEMGIPPVLYDRVQIWRIPTDGKGSTYRYSAKTRGNRLQISTNQNSILMFCIGTVAVMYGNMKFVHYLQEYSMRKFFNMNLVERGIEIPVSDENGDFTIYFKFGTTERPGGAKAFLENEEKAMARIEELEKKAKKEQRLRVDNAVAGRPLTLLERWKLKKERDKAMETITREAILQEFINEDPVMRELNASPDAQPPRSVLEAIEMVKKANNYLNNVALVRPLNIHMEVYLVDKSVINSDNGRCVKRVGGNPFLLVNMENMLVDNGSGKMSYSFAAARGQSTLLTIVHELFHGRQQCNYCPVHMSMYPAEATAGVLEFDAARWFRKKGIIPANVDAYRNDGLQMSPREHLEIFARSLDEITVTDKYSILDLANPEALYQKTFKELSDASDIGYTMAYVIEAAREYAGKKDRSMHYLVAQYPEHGASFSEMIRYGLPINEKTFDKAWVYFCDLHMKTMYSKQNEQSQTDASSRIMTECYSYDLKIDEGSAAVKLEVDRKNHYFRVWNIALNKKSGNEFNFFVTNRYGGQKISPYVHFFCVPGDVDFKDGGGNKEVRYLKNPGSLKIGGAFTSYSKQETPDDYYGVALFKPRDIKINKIYEDRVAFTLPKVSKELIKKGLISGAEVTLYPSKGRSVKKIVSPDDFSDKQYFDMDGLAENTFALSVHWFYEEDENTVYVSPESEKVYYKVQEKPEEEEETEETDETESFVNNNRDEGGYWRLVKVEVDDSKAKAKDKDGSVYEVSGGGTQYQAHVEIIGNIYKKDSNGINHIVGRGVTDVIDRTLRFDRPKNKYKEGERIGNIKVSAVRHVRNGVVRAVENQSSTSYPNIIPNIYGPSYDYKTTLNSNRHYPSYSMEERDYLFGQAPARGEGFQIVYEIGDLHHHYAIMHVYHYEWVEGK